MHDWGNEIRTRLASLRLSATREAEIVDELSQHLEDRYAELIGAGVSPQEATRLALDEFHSADHLAQYLAPLRQSRARAAPALAEPTGGPLSDLWMDVRYAVRQSVMRPGFSVVVVVTLALGIGANTAIFSVVNAVLLRSLPYPEADRLVRIVEHVVGSSGPRAVPPLSLNDLAEFRSQVPALENVAAYTSAALTLTLAEQTARVRAARVSPVLFEMLAAKPLLGRTLEASDEVPGHDKVAILSHDTWQRYLAGVTDLQSQFVVIDGVRFAVVGVMPDGFQFPDPDTELWVPLSLPLPAGTTLRAPVVARLSEATSIESATAQVNATVRQLRGESANPGATEAKAEIQLVPITEELVGGVRPVLWLLTGAVVVVLLIACLNFTSLLLSRAAARQREFSVRLALGASSSRLVRQLLVESIALAVVGGVCGTWLAIVGVRVLRALGAVLPRRDLGTSISIPRLNEIGVDANVLLFTLLISLGVGICCGLLPALRQLKAGWADGFRDSPTSYQLRGLRGQFDAVLVVTQVGMAALLLVLATLLIQSFERLTNVPLGYDPSNVLTFRVSLPATRTSEPQLAAFGDALVERIESSLGTRTAAYTQFLPMVQTTRVIPVGMSRELSAKPPTPDIFRAQQLPPEYPFLRLVSSNFLSVMRIPIVDGRGFTGAERGGPPQIIINRTLARSGLLGQDVVGRVIYAGGIQFEIAGVADDIPQLRLDTAAGPQLFVEYNRLPAGPGPNPDGAGPYFVVRTEQAVDSVSLSIRQMVQQLDPQASMHDISSMDAILSNSLSRARLYAVLLGLFALTATVLASMGIYSVLANSVAHRTREIGVRMALGAERIQVVQLVLGRNVALATLGVLLGLVSAAALSRSLTGLVFEVSPVNAVTYAWVAMLCGVMATIASVVPVRRATAIDPATTLKSE
jgi:predicted permease